MITLEGDTITLRALEPEDIHWLHALENDESLWEVSHTLTPFSKHILTEYLKNSHRDIYEVKQLRLVITTTSDDAPVGCVDLFDFDPKHRRAGVGIIIFDEDARGKGFARMALQQLCGYAFRTLEVHQLYAHITTDNERSKQLFTACGFSQTSVRKDWIKTKEGFKDEAIYQCFQPTV
ncbi:GNAT family N-acetyltransferase [Altibacter sp. HG106]|uniref:GNAT family N-acetyltransferase n=1 Tax=Altibacter sp. HG106 TaxID=3023937 RepID=UPI0023509935|nr:GNAT family N-acetyltransferase [Altibacter sp. HG106]MDC7995606.1 GNAT family N-acetyltransferase [Altibacter sp. HG106]